MLRLMKQSRQVCCGVAKRDPPHLQQVWEPLIACLLLQAGERDEVPVGAVIVLNNKIIARAQNKVEGSLDPTAHAELLCIREAAARVEGWRLLDATLYVTLEPCPMCAGAILQARIGTLVYGSSNPLLGGKGICNCYAACSLCMSSGTARSITDMWNIRC